MELGTYVDELHRQLAAAAAAGGDEVRETAERLTTALDAAARLMLLEALGAAIGEISTELTPGSVDLRLRGRDPEFVVTPAPQWSEADLLPVQPSAAGLTQAPAAQGLVAQTTAEQGGSAGPATPAAVDGEEGATTRTTLRLPDELKARVDVAAAAAGISVNAWLVRAVAATLETASARQPVKETHGARVTGWVR